VLRQAQGWEVAELTSFLSLSKDMSLSVQR
jgi:hypothetical protein